MGCFNPNCLHAGVIWGADTKLEDQLAAASVLTAVAEVMWRHGVDLYSYQHAALKKSYDAALKSAANYDVSSLRSLPGIDTYQYVFRRYEDPRYLRVISQLEPSFTLAIDGHLPLLPPSESITK
jgi:hypothetical protein